jgi:hypothetical protein
VTTSETLTAHLTAAAIRLDEIADEFSSGYGKHLEAVLHAGVGLDALTDDQWADLYDHLGAGPPLESIDDLFSVPVFERRAEWRAQIQGLLAAASMLAAVKSGAVDAIIEHADDMETRTQRIAAQMSVAELAQSKVDRGAAKTARKARRNGNA